MPDDQPRSPSRYERVKQILNEAAGSAHPSYQGYDRFWNLPLAEFLKAELYGVRLIAPAQGEPAAGATGKSCCSGPMVQFAAKPQAGRGAASGLIKGLRGEAPFDGSQFPRLPWGGSPVSLENISFIEKWIDAGCPESDTPAACGSDRTAALRELAAGQADHRLHRGPANAFRDDTGSVKVRKNIDCLSPEELRRFRNAVAQMKSLDKFEQDERSFGYWARIHANQCQHSWEQFLTWHRAYLYFFEQQLQDIDPTVTLPYWDWAAYRSNLEISIRDMDPNGKHVTGIIPEAYRCWIDQQGLDELASLGVPTDVLEKLTAVKDTKFNSGDELFVKANITWGQDRQSDLAIIDVLGKINPLWHYQRWPGGNAGLLFEAYPRPEDVDRILQIDNFFDFASGPEDNHFFGALENLHNLIHNFSGGANPNFGKSTEPMNIKNPANGDMVNAGRTAFDPIFWGHHTNCDRLWAEWQKLHPNKGPDDDDAMLSPWTMSVRDTLSTAALGYEYMQDSHVYPTSNEAPIARFRSEAANLHPKSLDNHRRAEIRLHRVQYVTRAGFFVRVFLNQGDANESTATVDNPNYVGMINMFTGLCIGGPGHCEPPGPQQRRKFDFRHRHHKTPGNFRIDATGAIQRLKAAGATDFHVTLVALNIDGSLATDALHLDGVSLNFID